MAGIDLGDAWADGVWESGVWADGVWAGQEEVGAGGGSAGSQDASDRHVRSAGFTSRLIRGLRIIVFLALGAL